MSKKSSAKTKVHRVKAKTKVVSKKQPAKTKATKVSTKKSDQKVAKKSQTKTKKSNKNLLKIILSPIIKFNRYLKGSWIEIKKVRWPSRKETWQKVLSIIIYGLFFILLVVALDNLFDYLFKLMLGA